MPDLRTSTSVLDDFNRADENPILYTPQHPWVAPFVSPGNIQLQNFVLRGTSVGNTGSFARWDSRPQSGLVEGWGRVVPSYTFPEGTRQGLFNIFGQGYAVLETGGFSLILRKYTGGGGFIDITSSITAGDGLYTAGSRLQLMRLTATDMECWRTTIVGDDTTWTLTSRVPLTAGNGIVYTTDMYIAFGSTGNEDGWSEIGGPRRARTQMYRILRNTS